MCRGSGNISTTSRCRFRTEFIFLQYGRRVPGHNVSMRPGYHSVTPYLIARGAAEAIEFYQKAFGAIELMRVPAPDGRLMHSELQIGDSQIMMADEHPEMGY